MIEIETIEDIKAIHVNQIAENTLLEFKASPAVSDDRKEEIAKDVSAMANAAGGQIIYGMTEQNHLPAGLDDGVQIDRFNGLWFEQVIQQNLKRKVEGLSIRIFRLENGRGVVLVEVPPAQSNAPLQAKDGRYYRRRNFRNDIMEDYEIREAMRRQAQPELFALAVFEQGFQQPVNFNANVNDPSDLLKFFVHVGNRSEEPVLYSNIQIFIERSIVISFAVNFTVEALPIHNGRAFNVLNRNLAVPTFMPLFRGTNFRCTDPHIGLHVPRDMRGQAFSADFGIRLICPGFRAEKSGRLNYTNHSLSVELPDNQLPEGPP